MRSETDCVFPALALQSVRIRPTQSHQHVQFIQPSITRIWQAAISKLRCAESVHISCYIMLLNVGRAATEEHTAAAAAEQTPGKTVAIAERSATSTVFPIRAERYQKMPLPVLTFSANCEWHHFQRHPLIMSITEAKLPEKAESNSRLHPPLTTHRKKWHPLR